MPNIVERHKLVCSDANSNHNKYWIIELYDNNDVKTLWGRVGKTEQSKLFPSAGRRFMESKIAEKKRGKTNGDSAYTEIDVIDADGATSAKTSHCVAKSELKQIAKQQIQHSDPQVAKLIEYLVEVNKHDIYTATGGQISWNADKGLFATPLGIVTLSSISEARILLNDLAEYVAKKQYTNKTFISSLERYLTLIPQDIGMKFIPENILPDIVAIQKQGSILDALESSYKAVTTSPVDKNATAPKEAPKIFNIKLSLVDDRSLLSKVQRLYGLTRQQKHVSYGYDVKCVYMVEMPDHQARYEQVKNQINGVMELWHGTSSSNVISIMKRGLVLPGQSSAYVTGAMFGSGIYFSDQSTKSLNYACGYWGGSRHNRIFMFLADVAMGNYYVPAGPTQRRPPSGYHSYFAKAGKSGVINNEMVVFDPYQVNLKFLVEFE